MHSVAIMVSGVIYVQKCLLDNNNLIYQIKRWTSEVFFIGTTLWMVTIKHIPSFTSPEDQAHAEWPTFFLKDQPNHRANHENTFHDKILLSILTTVNINCKVLNLFCISRCSYIITVAAINFILLQLLFLPVKLMLQKVALRSIYMWIY